MRSVRGHRAFADLQRSGYRTSAGAIWITFNADVTVHPRLAFAINRNFGSAVVRNRVRRQLRSLIAGLAETEPQLLPAGDYLVGVRGSFEPGQSLDIAEAKQWLIRALEQLAAQRAGS